LQRLSAGGQRSPNSDNLAEGLAAEAAHGVYCLPITKRRFLHASVWTAGLAALAVITACSVGFIETSDCVLDFDKVLKGELSSNPDVLRSISQRCLDESVPFNNSAEGLWQKERRLAVGAMAASGAATLAISELFGIELAFDDPLLPTRNQGWKGLSPLQRVLIQAGADPLFRLKYPLLAEDLLPMNIVASLNDSDDPSGRGFPDSPTPAQVRGALTEAINLLDAYAPYLRSAQAPRYSDYVLRLYDSRQEASVNYQQLEIANIRANLNQLIYTLRLIDLYEFDTSVAGTHFATTVGAAFGTSASNVSLRIINPSPYGDQVTVRQSASRAQESFSLAIAGLRTSIDAYGLLRDSETFNLIAPGSVTASELQENEELFRKLGSVENGGNVTMEIRSDDQTQFATVRRVVNINQWLTALPASLVEGTASGIRIEPDGGRYRIEVFGPGNTVAPSNFLMRYLGMLAPGQELPANVFKTTPRFISGDKTVYDLSRIVWDDLLPDVKFTIQ
jgi:hypothetical protein